MKISEEIRRQSLLKNRNGKWLSEKLGIKESTLSSKFKNNTFTAEELMNCAILLDIDLTKLKEKIMENYFPFNEEKFEVFEMNQENSRVSVDKIPVRGIFKLGNQKYYVLWGVKNEDGEWELMTITNDSTSPNEYTLKVVRGYRIYQMKMFGIELEIVDMTAEDVICEVWGIKNDINRAQMELNKRLSDFQRNPIML